MFGKIKDLPINKSKQVYNIKVRNLINFRKGKQTNQLVMCKFKKKKILTLKYFRTINSNDKFLKLMD
jgi:hypothetical protein